MSKSLIFVMLDFIDGYTLQCNIASNPIAQKFIGHHKSKKQGDVLLSNLLLFNMVFKISL